MEISTANRVFLPTHFLAFLADSVQMTGYGPFGSTAKRTFACLRESAAERNQAEVTLMNGQTTRNAKKVLRLCG